MSDGVSKFALAAGVAALGLSGYVAATAVPSDVAGRVDGLESSVSRLGEADVGGLAERVTAIEASSAATIAPEEFGQLTQRVQELAGLVSATSAAQDQSIGALESDVDGLAERLAAAEETLETVQGEAIGGLSTRIGAVETRVGEVAEGLASAVTAATAMDQTVATVRTDVAALSGRVDEAATTDALDALSASLQDMVAGGLVPVGAILPWHPDMAGEGGIPAGFLICDGRTIDEGPLAGQSTPDLRDRFLMGADQAGQTGGARDAETDAAGGHAHDTAEGGALAVADGEGAAIAPVDGHTHVVAVMPPYVTVVYVMRVE